MTERNNGGPAFPALDFIVPSDLEAKHVHRLGETRGMRLRDYFAGQVLSNMKLALYTDEGGWSEKTVAKICFVVADAMLTERAK